MVIVEDGDNEKIAFQAVGIASSESLAAQVVAGKCSKENMWKAQFEHQARANTPSGG